MHQHSLMSLHPTVKEKMHLQENTLFYLDLGVMVTGNVAQCPLHRVTNAPTKFEVTTSKGLGGDTLFKTIHYLTLGLRSHDMLPSFLCIKLQSLKLRKKIYFFLFYPPTLNII